MDERNGVKVGQRVRDLDGKDLGRVTRLHDWGLHVARGMFLFRREAVVLYSELRGVRDGVLVVARSGRDLDALAAGELPPSWRIPAPPEFPSAATPSEAQAVFGELAHAPRGAAVVGYPEPAAPLTKAEEREYSRSGGQAAAGVAQPDAPGHA